MKHFVLNPKNHIPNPLKNRQWAQEFEERFLTSLERKGLGKFLSVRKVEGLYGEKQHGPFSV